METAYERAVEATEEEKRVNSTRAEHAFGKPRIITIPWKAKGEEGEDRGIFIVTKEQYSKHEKHLLAALTGEAMLKLALAHARKVAAEAKMAAKTEAEKILGKLRS